MAKTQNPGHSKSFRFVVLMGMLAAILFFSSACSTLQLNSRWNSQGVVVNGRPDEWQGDLTYIKKDDFSLGLRNDDRYVYVCLYTESRMMRSMAQARGLTVWFDPNGGRSKVFGIQYPMGRAALQQILQQMSEEERQDLIGKIQQGDQDARRKMAQLMMRDAVILGPQKNAQVQIPITELTDVEVRMSLSSQFFVYELKMPLAVSEQSPYAIGASTGLPLGVGIEIQGMARFPGGAGGGRGGGSAGMGGEMGGGGGEDVVGEGGGGAGMGGGRGGGMRGGMSGSRPRGTSGVKFWAKVELAKSN
jgi:hypothetical protein